jgi:hypothetical protein
MPVHTTNNGVDPHALLHPPFAVAPIFLNDCRLAQIQLAAQIYYS